MGLAGDSGGYAPPGPAPGSSSLDPVHNFTGFRKSTSFCVEREGRCGALPHAPTRELLPGPGAQWGLVLRNQRVSVWSGRDDVGRCPTPRQGRCPWIPVHNFTGFKKSVGFCVEQQERMCCSIPRQRLSVRSGPGQPVDRGFSGCRVWGKTCFPPERSPENRFLPRGTWP